MRVRESKILPRVLTLCAFLLPFPWGALAQKTSVPARILEAVDNTKLVVLRGNVQPLARPEFDQGSIPDAQPLRRMLLVLQRSPEQESSLRELLDAQQDKSSPNFHSWLTPEQFGEEFGPADADIQAVTEWLAAQGFHDIRVAAGRGVIEFSGSVGTVRAGFHTQIRRYLVNGETHLANAGDPSIPAALAPVLNGIVSLHDSRKKPMYHSAGAFHSGSPAGAEGSTRPSLSSTCHNPNSGQNVACYPLGPTDFATIYNVLPLWNASPAVDGTGQSIAIVGRTDINVQDVADFRKLFNLPPNPPQVIVDGADPGVVGGDETESILDVEWSGAVAKGATIKLVISESTETTDGVDLSALYIVDNNLAPVLSESYGQCELRIGTAGNQFESNLWEQAAAQGISVFVSTGDNGAAGCDGEAAPAQYGLQVNGLASTPFNTAVGGTDFAEYFNAATYWNATGDPVTLASAKGYIPETPWNNSCTNSVLSDPHVGYSSSPEANCNNSLLGEYQHTVGGSGGMSSCTSPSGTTVASCAGGYAKPSWQVAPGVPSDGKRDLPDVSLMAGSGFADQFNGAGSFYVICETDISFLQPCSSTNFAGVGGTSASTPAFAGLLALVNQKTDSRQGNPNYVLYKLAASQSASACNSNTGPAASCIFNDITSGTIAMPCTSGSPNCTTSVPSDQNGILNGYAAGTGYDQTTGLGSVNAKNLVNNWTSASRTASTSSLTLNSGTTVNITHGTAVPVSVAVSPASPAPSGNVALVATQGSNSFGFGTMTLSGGTATGTSNALPGGVSYTVQAHYEGDSNYAPSDSNGVTVSVRPENSLTNVHIALVDWATGQVTSSNASSVVYGANEVLRADITNSSAATCTSSTLATTAYACPTGSISLALDGTAVGPGAFPMNSEGYAESSNIQLVAGTHSLSGTYSGDNSYQASSGTGRLTVTPAPTVTGTQTLYPLSVGVPVGLQVSARTVNYGEFPVGPSGTFTLYEDGTAIPATQYELVGVIYPAPGVSYVWATIDGEMQATFSGVAGPHQLTVSYSGDANYGASSSAPATFNLVYPTQTTLSSSAPTSLDGQAVTLTARIAPSQNAAAAPTGSMTFSINSNAVSTATVVNGQATFTLSTLPAGSTPITASYSGDNFYASSSGTFTQNVTPVSTTTTVTSASSSVAEGTPVVLTAHVTPARMGAAPAGGTVQFTMNSSSLGGASVSNNQAQITAIFQTSGTIQVQAAYSGDLNYSGSSGTFSQTVTPPPPDFSITTTGTKVVTVAAGQTAVFSNAISVAPLYGFNAQVSLTCSSPAAATTCTISPNMLASGSGSAGVSVSTTARNLGAAAPVNLQALRSGPVYFLVGLILLCACILWVRLPGRRMVTAVCAALLFVAAMLGAASCGGGGSTTPPPAIGTPAGQYTILVTGASGATTHQSMLTMVVN